MRETLGEIQDENVSDNFISRDMWYESFRIANNARIHDIHVLRLRIMTAWLLNNSEQKHNMCVASPSTPAQYFHVLRRQIHRPFAKPLVLMTGKWLHIHSFCTSDLAELGPGTFFRRLIIEGHDGDNMKSRTKLKNPLNEPARIKRVIFCTGQVRNSTFVQFH